MKTRVSILLLFVAAAILAVSAQRVRPAGYESVYFDREDYIPAEGDTIIYLYEKGGREFFPEQRDLGELFGFRKMGKDLFLFFKREFPDLIYPEDLLKFIDICLFMWVDHDGNIVNFYYRFKSDNLYLYPDMEKHLYNFAMSVKKEGVKKYDIYALYPNSYCEMNYNFSYIYKALVMPQKY